MHPFFQTTHNACRRFVVRLRSTLRKTPRTSRKTPRETPSEATSKTCRKNPRRTRDKTARETPLKKKTYLKLRHQRIQDVLQLLLVIRVRHGRRIDLILDVLVFRVDDRVLGNDLLWSCLFVIHVRLRPAATTLRRHVCRNAWRVSQERVLL